MKHARQISHPQSSGGKQVHGGPTTTVLIYTSPGCSPASGTNHLPTAWDLFQALQLECATNVLNRQI
jgi:hypothetical protein